jgi:hypothetical protein
VHTQGPHIFLELTHYLCQGEVLPCGILKHYTGMHAIISDRAAWVLLFCVAVGYLTRWRRSLAWGYWGRHPLVPLALPFTFPLIQVLP